jgi:hypothetical protein
MLKNRISLDALGKLPIGEIAALSVEELMMLQAELAEFTEEIKKYNARLDAALEFRFADLAADMRQTLQKDTGEVHVVDGAFDILCGLPKIVKWDQTKMKLVIELVKEHGFDPEKVITAEYKVNERKYKAWPTHVKDIFLRARTIHSGKQSFKITKKD